MNNKCTITLHFQQSKYMQKLKDTEPGPNGNNTNYYFAREIDEGSQ